MGRGIAIAGNIFVDLVKLIDAYPQKGMLANIRTESPSVGGCVCNTIIDLAVMDASLPLKAIGAVGNDSNGAFALNQFKKSGVDASCVLKKSGVATGYTDVFFATGDNTRTFFTQQGSNRAFTIDDIDFGTIDADMFHMGYALLLDAFDAADPEYGTVLARVLATAQKRGMKTSMDVVSEQGDRFARIVTPSLKHCNYAIMNEIESAMVIGIPARDGNGRIIEGNIRAICNALLNLGVEDCAVIHAPEAGYFMTASREFFVEPSLKLPFGYIKGTVGAGDAFCAGTLYGLYKGMQPAEILKLATASASANLASKDAVGGALPYDRLMAMYNEYRGRTEGE